jgi:arsenate reductase (glutaredoxin)
VSYLEGSDVEVVKHDLAKELPSRELLDRIIDEDNLDQFLNKRSPAFKQLNLGGRKLTKAEAIDLMLKEPNLIRRPIIIRGDKAAFGFVPGEVDEVLRS